MSADVARMLRHKPQVKQRWAARLALPLAAILAFTSLGAQAQAKEQGWTPPVPKDVAGVAAPDVTGKPVSPAWPADAESRQVRGPQSVTWPAGTATVDLADISADGRTVTAKAGPVKAAGLPVTLSDASGEPLPLQRQEKPGVARAKLTVYDQATTVKAGVKGLLLSAQRTDGRAGSSPVNVEVDYREFARAYGGDWATRLQIVALPACALSTPDIAACRNATPLKSVNNPNTGTVSAQVPVGSSLTVMSVQSGPSGDSGSFSATPLAPAGTWNVGTQTGDFTWSTSLRMPPALGAPSPGVSFAYSSGSVDGRTATTNNQGGWIGDGWDSWPGFIERRYASCADDNPSHETGDQCWYSNNATMSLNGRAGELIETTTPNVFRLKNDDGTRIEKLADANRANGDNDSEYWKVTTTDGVQYFFGQHRLPGWTAGKPVTDSVWTVPVYGNNSGEPCHNATFANAWCDQAWRWNLDYVVDPSSNTMAYFYGKEAGAYGRDNNSNQRTTYIRGGWLDRIEYGMRNGSEYTTAAPMRVLFSTAERCLAGAGCWTGTPWESSPVAAAWPDTPFDQDCASAPCAQTSATFWSARRLAKVTTQVRSGSSTYRDVESWTLRHEFLDAGNSQGIPMWLLGITHAGLVTTAGGTAVADPEITFAPNGNPMPNRVDGPSVGRSNLNRWRINTITTESGGQIKVTYTGGCTRASLPNHESNTTRCMPSMYDSGGNPILDWFHKYVVTKVSLHDSTTDSTSAATNPDQITFYDYLDGAAWHYNDDELTKPDFKTWGDWRGYGRVQVRTGPETGTQTAVETRYLRGMNGDQIPGGTRSVNVTDSWGNTVTDHEALRGFVLETKSFNGAGGAETTSTVNTPWVTGPTATRTTNGVTVNAWKNHTATTRTRSSLAAGGFRTVKTTTSYNADGLPVAVDNFGDENAPGDETCLRTQYARNDATWMIDRVSLTETLSGTCPAGGSPPAPATVLSRNRTFYDTYAGESSFGAAPTRGLAVRTEDLDSWTGTTPVYVRTATLASDTLGRVTSTVDALSQQTTTVYNTDGSTGLVTSTAVTNALNQSAITHVEPAWGQPVKTVDANGIVTDITYDGAGRALNVWLPGRSKATQPLFPSLKFTYLLRSSGGPTVVTTETLRVTGNAYRKSAVLYDGFMRARQTQQQAPGGGRTVIDTLHNAAGRVDWTSAPFYDNTHTAVGTSFASPQGALPSVTQFVYDGAGRTTAQILKGFGNEKWRTTTAFFADRVNITPPEGGTATTSISDASGQTTELRQYRAIGDVGSNDPAKFDKTTYTYTVAGQLKTVTDVAGNIWSYDYDLRGRQWRSTDPDTGTTTTTFDAGGQPRTITAPLGTGTATTAFTYDAVGRTTSVRDDSITGTKRAEWVYDTLPYGKGKLTSATRYTGGNGYVSKVDNYDSFGRPTSTSVVLPSAESDLCAAVAPNTCTYSTAVTYKANGQLATVTMPAAADLASEKLTIGYNDVDAPGTLMSPIQTYVSSFFYDKLDQLIQRHLGRLESKVVWTATYDEPTRRVTDISVVPDFQSEAANYTYTYDNAGNVKKISEAPAGQTADHQCFTYDHLRRLTDAWTPGGGDCNATKTVSGLGGPAPYWNSWTFDAAGNRKTETQHGAIDTTLTHTYPASGTGSVRPHTVTNVTSTGGQAWSRNYTYDNAGNTKTRPTSTGATQTLAWDREGRMTSSTDGSGTTSYLQDADGARLIRKDPDGSKTLYLPGGTEVRNVGTVKTATRYYSHAGETIATRTAAGVQWITSDHHGTAELTIKASDLTVAKQRRLPYGKQRGTTSGTWAPGMDKGFVGGTSDPSGLTHIGAREYDPAIGAFISRDQIVDVSDPQQMTGYAYSNHNPVTYSDPTGMMRVKEDSGPAACGSLASCNALGEYDAAQKEIDEAQKNAKQSFTDILIKEGLNLLLDMLGINDIIDCFTKGDIMACGSMILSVLPVGKIFKVASSIFKAVDRAFSAFKTWKRVVSAANAVLSKADDMLKAAKSKLDNVLSKADDACDAHSFTPATLVLMADGTTKPIRDVALGDRVMATDPNTGETVAKEVTVLHRNMDQGLAEVTVKDEVGNTSTIETTWNHPFWDATNDRWTNAADLTIGTSLRDDTGKETSQVVAVRTWTGLQEMRDLTVAEIHTYYVMAADQPVLVHNCGGGLSGAYNGAKRLVNVPRAWLNNRSLSRSLNGVAPEPNATVRDLLDFKPGNPQRQEKLVNANARSDEDLLNSVFNPRDNQFIATNGSMPNTILQGNHRVYQLLQRAADPGNLNITYDTRIFINRGGW